MSMEGAAWSSLYKISSARDGGHGISRASVRRIMTFAVPYRSKLVVFIALSVVGAVLAVATPVLAGRVVRRGIPAPVQRWGRRASGGAFCALAALALLG